VSLPRPVVHLLLLASIAGGVWIGMQVYRFFAGG
jgi:hypothetical protein